MIGVMLQRFRPFPPGRKARPAAPAQPGPGHFVDDLPSRRFPFEKTGQRLISAERNIFFNVLRIDNLAVFQYDPRLFLKIVAPELIIPVPIPENGRNRIEPGAKFWISFRFQAS